MKSSSGHEEEDEQDYDDELVQTKNVGFIFYVFGYTEEKVLEKGAMCSEGLKELTILIILAESWWNNNYLLTV